MATLSFLGAAKTTTGSKFLLSWQSPKGPRRLLIDCGMFQGLKELRLKNREPFPTAPEIIDAVILTHAHLDHCGYLPRLVGDGFDGPVYATPATCDIAEIILRDSAHIQEEEAYHAKKFGWSKHKDPRPVYTTEDVEATLPLLTPLPYYRSQKILDGVTVRFHHAGHILGSAFVEVTLEENGRPVRIVFSGDVGRYDQPILLDPEPPTGADYFLLEGTYGDRVHGSADPKEELAEVVNRVTGRGGTLVIPAFAVGRSQQMLYYLAELQEEGRIPRIDTFLDSPMAVTVTRYVTRHQEELDADTLAGLRGKRIFRRPEVHLLESREDSQKLNQRGEPCIIISASGMITGGRVLHHLERRLPDERNGVLLVGYQAAGTRGRRLQEGEEKIKIHGQMIPVRAEVVTLSALSAHADYTEMLPWLRRMVPPSRTFIVHGEGESLAAWAGRLESELGWNTWVPDLGEEVELPPVSPAARPAPPPPRPIERAAAAPAVEPAPAAAEAEAEGEAEAPAPAAGVIPGGARPLLVVEEGAVIPPNSILPEARILRGAPGITLLHRILAAEGTGEVVYVPANHREAKDRGELLARLREEGRTVWVLRAME